MAARIEQLTERVRIMTNTSPTKPNGWKPSDTWTLFLETWARVEYKAGQEVVAANQVQATRTHLVTTRYFEGLKASDKIEWGSRTLDIVNYGDPDGSRTWLEINCTEAN